METRNITIINTRTQSNIVISTDATTLGELKSALSQQGIDYEGMSFYEGLTRTEILDDSSLLPHDVEYKGSTTNELVFMLTNTNKKIKSGASRSEMYAFITSHNLTGVCITKFSKNFTQCKNSELEQIIAEFNDDNDEGADGVDIHVHAHISAPKKEEPKKEEPKVESAYSDDEIAEMFNFIGR